MAHKINKALFNSLNEIIHAPFIIIDNSGDILSINSEAKILFSFDKEKGNFFELLNSETDTSIGNLVQEAFEKQKNKTEDVQLILSSGIELNLKISVNVYKEGNELFVFLSFLPQNNKIELSGVTNLQVKSNDVSAIIKNQDIIGILEEVRSLYPFTFIGREKLLKKVNKLEELFWIKDVKGIFVFVNDKLAGSLGLKLSQVEGKNVESFLPPYLVEFNHSIDKYIRDSLNCLIIEGLPALGIASKEEYQTVVIPLTDADHQVIATIGVAQKIKPESRVVQKEYLSGTGLNMISDLPRPLALVDINGIIKHGSKEFCKLFSTEFSDLRGFYFTKVLPIKISEKVRQFLDSSTDADNFEAEIQQEPGKDNQANYIFYLNKIYNNENALEGISIFAEFSNADKDIEQLLNRRGRMFEILIQNNPEPMFIYDTENLRFIEANEAALSLYGYRKDEFLQMDLTDLYTPEDIQTLLDSSSLSSRIGKFTGPFKHKKKDGSYVFVEISKISFKYKDKDAHFNIVKDVTSQLDLDRRNQIFKTAFDNTNDLLFLTDNIGIITFANNSVKQVLGYSRNELESNSFSSLVKDEERGTINSSIFQSYLKEQVTITIELKKSDGSYVEVELTASPVLDYKSEIESFSIIAKPTAQAGQLQAGNIKEVIKEVIVERPAPSGSGEAEPANVNFLSSLFHEILTPINVILGFVQEFTGDVENLTPEQKEAADIINQNRSRLLNTMNTFIEYSEIQRNDFEIKSDEVGITEVIDRLHTEFKEIIGSREIEFAYGKISSSLKFESDKQKFQTLAELLMRIITAINKEKKIYFSAYQYDDDSFMISIKDNYSFVSKHMLENLLNIFQRDDSAIIKDFGIPKLTFKLSKSLLNLLKGRIEVIEKKSDKPDYGFIFPLRLSQLLQANEVAEKIEETVEEAPEEENKIVEEAFRVEEEPAVEKESRLEEVELEEKIAEEELEEEISSEKEREQINAYQKSGEKLDLRSLTCLYIEDQVDSQILFKVQMKELKDIKFAVSFEDALPLLDNFHFDFIVMDINLQGEYNGLDALKIIHKMPRYESIPIIAVTAYVLPGDKEKFIATGFNDFISKPIFREKMIDSLEKIFLMQM